MNLFVWLGLMILLLLFVVAVVCRWGTEWVVGLLLTSPLAVSCVRGCVLDGRLNYCKGVGRDNKG